MDLSGVKRVSAEGESFIPDGKGETIHIMPLGAGQEVGRSAVIVEYKGRTVMFDCGVHPVHSGIASLPFFDQVDPSKIDIVLVTHFHLDHCGAVPYFLKRTTFRGRLFMTVATRAIYRLMLADTVKMTGGLSEGLRDQLYSADDVEESLERIETIDYHQQEEHNGIKITCYNAGHVLGAAMFLIDIAGVTVLYTGDFSRNPDRHLVGAETPSVRPDIVIVESTYGTMIHERREDRESRFCSLVHQTVAAGGRCLIPVFAIGRTQELLLILDEYWETHPFLQNIPMYYASALSRKCITVFRTYINMMNEHIRKRFEFSNPFNFKHITNLGSLEEFEDRGPCVILAAPAMLQNGVSRILFDRWCTGDKNRVILTAYSAEGSFAKNLLSEPRRVNLLSGREVSRKIRVDELSFSAHSDFEQTSQFIFAARPRHIVLVHGDRTRMTRLKDGLEELFKEREDDGYHPSIFTPANCESIEISFSGEKRVKIVGSLGKDEVVSAGEEEKSVRKLQGLLIQKGFQHFLVSPDELGEIVRSGMSCLSFHQRLVCPLHEEEWNELVGVLGGGEQEKNSRSRGEEGEKGLADCDDEVVIKIEGGEKKDGEDGSGMEGEIDGEEKVGASDHKMDREMEVEASVKDEEKDEKKEAIECRATMDGKKVLFFQGKLALTFREKTHDVVFEWNGDDVIDSFVDFVIITMLKSQRSFKNEGDVFNIYRRIQIMLRGYMDDVELDLEKEEIRVKLNGSSGVIGVSPTRKGVIEASDDAFKSRLEMIFRRILLTIFPVPEGFCTD
eukprot:TRINITY_DN1143_c2_g1_i1.p1 TRINITY_DN1143_c2_g1~~TRINITY_DN1143_c2_g1_i1.p1  ORF type:complete len:822 (-),score=241.90 TRINITY_DN1143_c2_g1_i1:1705-4062(-)